MRYEDYEDSANDEYDIEYCSIRTTRQRKQASDDYELLENYEFISHLESSGLLKEYRETLCKREPIEDIHIDLNFMEDPSFYHEVEYFDKLNKTLEMELVELDGKLTTPPSIRKLAKIHSKSKIWRVQLCVGICALLVMFFVVGIGYFTPGFWDSKGDVYASDDRTEVTKDLVASTPTISSEGIKDVLDIQSVETKSQGGLSKDKTYEEYNDQKVIPSDKKSNKEEHGQQFQDTAFIGNSLVVGLKQTCKITGASFYAYQSLDIGDAFQKAFVYDRQKGSKSTILEALSKKQFKKIYLMFGINELGWPYSDVFIQKYSEFIQQIKELQPSAELYVLSILPVTRSCSDKKPVFSKSNILEHNELLKKMSTDLKVEYLDLYSSLCNKNGYLPEDSSTDGIHLRKASYIKWLDYLKEEISGE